MVYLIFAIIHYNALWDSNFYKVVKEYVRLKGIDLAYEALNNKLYKYLFIEHLIDLDMKGIPIKENPIPMDYYIRIGERPTKTNADVKITPKNRFCFEMEDYFNKYMLLVYMLMYKYSAVHGLFKEWATATVGLTQSEI